MIVLHAIWDHLATNKIHLWAESSSAADSALAARRAPKRQPKAQHPFALSAAALKEEVSALVDNKLPTNIESSQLTLRLPTKTKGPVPSPELILEKERSDVDAAPTFKPWEVATLALSPRATLDVLLPLPDTAPHGSAFGASLRFWTQATWLAFELIAQQHFVPVLRETRNGNSNIYQAKWEPAFVEDDARRVRLLAEMMPPSCLAFLPEGKKLASLRKTSLEDFLNCTIDAFARETLAVTTMVQKERKRRSSAKQAVPEKLLFPERWLHALNADDPTVTVALEKEHALFTALRTWLSQIQPESNEWAFRTCFRLDPPDKEVMPPEWLVTFHLQANDDRSLLVPAEQVWQERSSTLTFLKRTFDNPQERLLADLGKASRVFPAIERSLRTAHPGELRLNTEQAYTFLRESAQLLEQSGFGVLIPPWWNKRSTRLGVKLRIKPKSQNSKNSQGLLGLRTIVTYDWSASVGEMTLSEEEFEALVDLKLPLVQVRGQWVELRPEEIEAAISFFAKQHNDQEMTLGDALQLGLGEGTSELGLPVLDVAGDGWLHDLLASLTENAKLSTIKQPTALQGQLRPYQLKGTSWMAFLTSFGFGACLADDMGMGKTISLIALILNKRAAKQPDNKQQRPQPTLLICPMSIVGNWQRELQRFAPSLSVMVHHGAERLSGPAFTDEALGHDMVITTYPLALRDKEHLAALTWEHIVLDEAQNIKNESAKQTQAIRSLKAEHKIALTGTPVENRLSELWSIMEFLNPGYLGSGAEFRTRFATPIEKYHDQERAETLRRLTQPFILRRLKTDKTIIQDLPDKLEMKVYCNLTQEQASLYEAVVKEMMEQIEESEGIQRKGLVLSTLLKLKQICNHPAHFVADGSSLPGRSGKLARLEEMLEEALAIGDKALIFTQFAEMGTLLRHHLQETFDCEALFLHGGTSKKQRDTMVQRFQEERRGVPIFILSLKAGGVGLNLTAANHVFHFDRWWNPAVENQATDRAFRIGQTRNVQVHKFLCVGTMEEHIDQMIEQKKGLAESIVGSGENWLTEMSTDQLKEIFALSREAVGV